MRLLTITVTAILIVVGTGPPLTARHSPSGERYAVVIGVSVYDHSNFPPRPFADNSVRALFEFLVTDGEYKRENVLLLTDTTGQKPTLTNIKDALGSWLYRRAGNHDSAFVYWSGHGVVDVELSGIKRESSSRYLIPRDGDRLSLFTTGFALDDIVVLLERLHAENVVVVLDASYSSPPPLPPRLRRPLPRGRVLITACGPDEEALDLPEAKLGLFTYYLLRGFKGDADANRDGIVTVNELYQYVRNTVSVRARLTGKNQTPSIRSDGGDLPLVHARTQ